MFPGLIQLNRKPSSTRPLRQLSHKKVQTRPPGAESDVQSGGKVFDSRPFHTPFLVYCSTYLLFLKEAYEPTSATPEGDSETRPPILQIQAA